MKKYICPLLTLLKDEETIDFEAMHQLYDTMIAAEILGVALLGSSGEFYALKDEMCQALVDDALSYIDGRVAVYVGANRMNDQETIACANRALEKGATGILLIGPYYIGCESTGLKEFFGKMARNIQGDIILYNYPERTGYDLEAELVLGLAQKYKNIVGIKDTVMESEHTVKLIGTILKAVPDFEIYTGYDCNTLTTLQAGGAGAIAAISNIAPELCVSIVRRFSAGDLCGAESAQGQVDDLMKLYSFTNPFMPTFKYLLHEKGIKNNGFTYLPAMEIMEDDKDKALRIFQEQMNETEVV